jgi:glycerol-3-phosphate O-acyltransferase
MSRKITRNRKTIMDAREINIKSSKENEVGLEVNPEKTKYMLVSRCQKAGQRQSIKIGNRSFESVAKFKYLGTTLTDQNCIQEEIKSKTKFRECLLPFGSESFVIPPAVQECKG